MDILKEDQIHTLISIADKIIQLQNNIGKNHNSDIKPVINIIDQLIDKILL
jgi:hypothetical protein